MRDCLATRCGWRRLLGLGSVLALLCGLASGALAAGTQDRPAPKSITVVMDDNYPPYVFRDESGNLQGILKDVWSLWSARTGIAVNLVATDWAKAQQIMQAGGGDVIDTMFKTEQRQLLYDFSPPYARIDVPLFFHASLSGIADAESARPFTVGVKDGDACVETLQQRKLTDLKRYPSYETLVRGAAGGEVKVFCMDEPPAMHLLYKLGLERNFRHSPPLYAGEFHWAVHKGNRTLYEVVAQGFARISAAERMRIDEKWQGSSLLRAEWHAAARYGGLVLLAIALLVLALAAWNRTLQVRVAAKTEELTATLNALQLAQDATRLARDQLAATLTAIPDLLFEMDIEGRYHDYRAAREELLAAPPAALLGRTVSEVMPAEPAQIVLAALREAAARGHAYGAQIRLDLPVGTHWFELSLARKPGPEGAAARIVVLSRDISERKRAEEEIERLAFFDPLTQLPNRRMLIDRLHHALATSQRRNSHGALLFIDLDDFKTLNDTRGHSIGDLLLVEVSRRLQDCVRGEDTVARLGGDEFVLMLEDLSAELPAAVAQAELVAEKVLRQVSSPYLLSGQDHHFTASIGISLFLGDQDPVDEMLKRADAAMYRAKTAGRNAIRFFDPEMQGILEARAQMEAELRRALPEQQLELHYQPQVDSQGRIIGVEALLRWQHPTRGMVSPAQFIPLAEETGLIVPIGRWVLETACRQLKLWQERPATRELRVSVNVSARQFRQPSYVAETLQVIAASGINPEGLKLELTESLVLDNVGDSIEKMHALKAEGMHFSMDDFGTGYSSLAYLKRLPLDQLKIDQSFVRDITSDAGDAVIVQTIIGMAANLGLSVIAEGVETEAQRDFLLQHGCGVFQGYLFSRPVTLAQIEVLLAA